MNQSNRSEKPFQSIRFLTIASLILCGIYAYGQTRERGKVFTDDGKFREELTVGETWIFEHHGVQSSGNIGQLVKGDRVQKVLSNTVQDGTKLWIMKETFGENDLEPRRIFLDAKRYVHRLEHGAEVLSLNPPVPFRLYDLKPDEEIEYSTSEYGGLEAQKVTMKAHRLIDETLDLPAGRYENCQKVKLTLTFETKQYPGIPITLHYMLWYHPKANGMVKESFKCILPEETGKSQTPMVGVSLLKSYSTGKKAS